MIRFIGDTHAKFESYKVIAETAETSVQVGDFGMGFNMPPQMSNKHRFIRGNHDNPALCEASPNWIADGTVLPLTDNNMIMFLGGAYSIDQAGRTEGVDWWREEELSILQLYDMIDLYIQTKPRIMITHDCPTNVASSLFSKNMRKIPSRTSQAFEEMFNQYQPECWIFGHWHMSRDRVIDDTRFICLDELNHIDMALDFFEGTFSR